MNVPALNILYLFLAALVGYLLGSIPVGYLMGRAWGVDVRQSGSGRTGGSNVLRATGRMIPFLLTGAGDIAKGVIAVWVGRYVFGSEAAAALAGATAVAGHNWPIFLGFKGGAGGATSAAALCVLSPLAGLIVTPIALSVFIFGRVASLATLTVGVGSAVTLLALSVFEPLLHPWPHLLFGIPVAVIIVLALQPNLKRLKTGTERRMTHW
jgi:glycerol-3-phosphate acyltransferase PlsY